MAWDPTLFSLGAFVGAGVCALPVVMAWREQSTPTASAFIGLMLAFGGWAFLYAVQLGFTTVGEQVVWQRFVLVVGGTVPTLWFVFTLRYTDWDGWLTPPVLAVLVTEPVVFAGLLLTNPGHELIWRGAAFPPNGFPRVAVVTFGPGYYVHIAYAYLLVACGVAVLLVSLVHSSRLYTTQTSLLIAGALPPFATHVIHTTGIGWVPLSALDLTPFVLPLTGLLFGLALFQFDLLSRTPVARERLLTETSDGVVVLDEAGDIVRLNPTARKVLTAPRPVGQSILDVVPLDEDADDRAVDEDGGDRDIDDIGDDRDIDDIHETTITTQFDGKRHVYDVSYSPLTDSPGLAGGYLLLLRDVTERHAYEQRLAVANRVLRHNLRNEMNVILGWAEQITATGSDEHARAAHHITSTAEELLELSDKARDMVETGIYVAAESEPEPVDVRDHVGPLLEDIQQEYPEATVEGELPSDVEVVVPAVTLLRIAIGNLLENAIEHNDSARPRVRVEVDERDGATDTIQIRVSDNGPGIPAIEQEVLETGTETPLHHGRGLGLWLVYWSITTAGGDVSFDSNELRGSTVTLTLQSG